MQCPICGSDRNPKIAKCPTCGVDYTKWLNKIINNLHKKTSKVMASAKKSEKEADSKPNHSRYREVIKHD